MQAEAPSALAPDASSGLTGWSGTKFSFLVAAPRGGNAWREESSGLELVPDGWRNLTPVFSIGHDWQSGRLTYGAHLSYAPTAHLAYPQDADFINCADCTTEVGDVVTLSARLGLDAGKFLLFADAGRARGTVVATNLFGLLTYADTSLSGWTIGIGAERQLGDGVSLTVRYDHVDLGTLPLPDYLPTGSTKVELDRMQAGLSVRW
ncbi:outer membrane protein [Tabrizicola flagellatus]|uniref:outer membrane protein n=1 Tax=Tabrizicola flagellatus TaxID=2593021 RepID=UPI0013583857|nr:hypothetical protein [Tabrizicola flagellatus]